jgi:hypothetical protein
LLYYCLPPAHNCFPRALQNVLTNCRHLCSLTLEEMKKAVATIYPRPELEPPSKPIMALASQYVTFQSEQQETFILPEKAWFSLSPIKVCDITKNDWFTLGKISEEEKTQVWCRLLRIAEIALHVYVRHIALIMVLAPGNNNEKDEFEHRLCCVRVSSDSHQTYLSANNLWLLCHSMPIVGQQDGMI